MQNLKKNKNKTVQLVRKTQADYHEKTFYLQEKDRKRLSEELHDNIIARLNLIRLNLKNKEVHDLNTDLKKSMQMIRELSHNLTPPDVCEIDFTDLLADYLDQIKEKINVVYSSHRITKTTFINSETKLNLFRIIQELTTNILKHANATKMEVSIRISLKYLVLIVEDNGCGFSTGNASRGIGLRNIQSRAKLMNAVYKIKTAPQKGTKCIVCVLIK